MTKALFIKKEDTSQYAPWHIAGSETFVLCDKLALDESYAMTYEEPKRVCFQCTCALLGYEIETVRAGQVRRYGPTINTYHVTDLSGNKSKDEILEFCRTRLHKAAMKGDDGYHPLCAHVMRFTQRSNGAWLYEAGHEYTG